MEIKENLINEIKRIDEKPMTRYYEKKRLSLWWKLKKILNKEEKGN